MRQEPALAVEGTGVAMETFGKEDHYVCEVRALVRYVAVGDLAEPQGRDVLPHLEGSPDGLVRLILPDLRGVVLNTEREERNSIFNWRGNHRKVGHRKKKANGDTGTGGESDLHYR